MKKFILATIAILICVVTVVGIISIKNKKEREQLLQESISAFEAGDYEKASDGFYALAKEANDPDLYTVAKFASTMKKWQAEYSSTKLSAYEDAQKVNSNYSGLLADDIHILRNIILEEGAKLQAEIEAEQQEALLQRIKNGKPFVGMDSKYISMTSLGHYDKTDYNYKKVGNKDQRCTLYYWMEGKRCIFIARVQDNIGEVINIDENPTGSYFGN